MADSPPAPTEHVVFFSGPDGGEGVERCSSLPAAVSRVEELANAGIEDAAVFALLPVPLQVRQVWRVEVNVAGAMLVGPSSDEAPAEQPVDAEPAAVGSGAERGDVLPTQRGRGLGFFAAT